MTMKIILSLILLVGMGFAQPQPSSTLQMQTPPPSGVQTVNVNTVGVQGSSNYCYWVVATFAGGMSNPLKFDCANRSNGTLNSSNYNTISWSPATDATGYWVVRSNNTSFPSTGTTAVNTTVLSASTITLNDQSNTLHAFTFAPMAVANASFRLVNTGSFIFPNVIGDTAYNITLFANLPAASTKPGILYVVYDSPSQTSCSGGGGTGTPSYCLSNGVTWIPMATSVSGGTTTIQTNGVNNSSQNPVNFTNSNAFNGLTLTQTNTSGGIVQLGVTGLLNSGGMSTTGVTAASYTNTNLTVDAAGRITAASNGSGGAGTVSSFSSGNLTPYFTTSVATSTTTPALSFAASTFAADSILGNFTASGAIPSTQLIPTCANDGNHALVYVGHTLTCAVITTGGSGTVTSFSSGNLAPLFTTSVATSTSTPALSFALSNFSADNIFGNFTAGSTTPSTQAIPACANDGVHALVYVSHILTCAALTTGGGGTVTSVSFTGGIVSVANPTTTPAFTIAGTSGGVPYFTSGSTWATSAALTANLPVIGGGAGSPPSVGTRSGNTTAFVTTTGAQTSGRCVTIDSNGNHVADTGACGTGSGGSVFDGSAVQSNSFSATPISLANVSVRSPTRIEMGTLTANVTGVTFSNVPTQGGAKFSLVWTQDGTGNRLVTYGGIVIGSCIVDPTAGVTTTQFFEVTAGGSNITGDGCTTDHTGVEGGPEAGTAPGSPVSGNFWRYVDPTSHAPITKTQAGTFNPVIALTCSGSDFVNSISAAGVVGCATPSGSGNVSNSGTPLIHQLGVWTAATTIKGIAVGATDKPLVGVSAGDPVFSKVTITNPATAATLTIGDNGSLITNGNSLTFTTSGTTAATLPSGSVVIPQTVVSGTASLGTSAIGANSCASTVTVSTTGVTTSDVITFTPNADISGITGYGPLSTDGLIIYPFPTSNNVNFKVCNGTGTSITPGSAVSLNFKVIR